MLLKKIKLYTDKRRNRKDILRNILNCDNSSDVDTIFFSLDYKERILIKRRLNVILTIRENKEKHFTLKDYNKNTTRRKRKFDMNLFETILYEKI